MSSVRVHFKLDQIDDYPPVSVESAWTIETPEDEGYGYVMDSIPFFFSLATLGDRISVEEEGGKLWFKGVVRRSGNSLIRVVLFDPSRTEEVRSALRRLGCDVEALSSYNLLAVSVPENVSLVEVQTYLKAMVDDSVIDYEEPILRQ